jgi:hypothetical protein
MSEKFVPKLTLFDTARETYKTINLTVKSSREKVSERLGEILPIMFSKKDRNLSKNLMLVGFYFNTNITSSETLNVSETEYLFLTPENKQFTVSISFKLKPSKTEAFEYDPFFRYRVYVHKNDYYHEFCSTTDMGVLRKAVRALVADYDHAVNCSTYEFVERIC